MASTSSLTNGLTPAVMRDITLKVFYQLNGYYGVEDLLLCVAEDQNLDLTRMGNKVALRGFIDQCGCSTSTNLRSRYMRKYIANSKCTPDTFIPELDAYLADDDSGHVL